MLRLISKEVADVQQLRQIMDIHSEQLLQLAYFYTKNYHAAEDIVQDVFIKFYNSNYEERGQLQAYLRKLTVNRAKDYVKSWSYKRLLLQDAVTTGFKRHRDHLVVLEEKSTIGEAILSLPIHYREMIILYYFEELTTPQIAELLLESESTVRTRLRRAREKLKPMLEDEWEVLVHE